MKSSSLIPAYCRSFGAGASEKSTNKWILEWKKNKGDISSILILAGSRTAEVEGISAAGGTPDSRKYTAIADAEFLLNGPSEKTNIFLPPLPAGVSPALISHVAASLINI